MCGSIRNQPVRIELLMMMMMMMMMMMINISNGKDIIGIQSVHTTITLQVCAELLYIGVRASSLEAPNRRTSVKYLLGGLLWFRKDSPRDPKLNMESENDCFQKESPLSGLHVQIPC